MKAREARIAVPRRSGMLEAAERVIRLYEGWAGPRRRPRGRSSWGCPTCPPTCSPGRPIPVRSNADKQAIKGEGGMSRFAPGGYLGVANRFLSRHVSSGQHPGQAMKTPRFLCSLSEKAIRAAHRHPRGILIAGGFCLLIAFLPYYSHTAASGPAEVDLLFIGKVKGPPERTHFHVGLPWSPWVRYWRVLEYQAPWAFNYSEGFNYTFLPGSAVPAVLGVALLIVAWRSRRAPAAELAATADAGSGNSIDTNG